MKIPARLARLAVRGGRLKVAFLVFNIDGMGGTSRSAITQANALAARGNCDVRIVSMTRSADAPHYPIDPAVAVDHLVDVRAGDGAGEPDLQRPSRLVPRRWDGQFSLATDLGAEAFLPGLDVDVLVTVTPALMALAVQLCRPGVAIVHQEHRSSADRGGGMEPLLAFAPRVAAVALLTRSAADWLAAQLGNTAPDLVVMPNPLPTEPQPRAEAGSRTIVSAGRIVPEKQFFHLVRAFMTVAVEIPEWRLRILGDGPVRADLVAHAAKNGFADRIELPGAVSDMRPEWARAGICALSSRTEGFPLVAQEAMSAGVPVVTYDCPSGPRELVTHDASGLLVPPGAKAGLAAALLRLAGDDALRGRLGAGALDASAAYDPDAIAERWEQIFARAAGRDSAGQGQPGNGQFTRLQGPLALLTPQQSRAEVIDLVTAAAGDDWFALPADGDLPPRIVLGSDRRGPLLAHLAAHAPEHLSVLDPGLGGWPERRSTPARAADLLANAAPARLVVEPWPRHAGRRTHLAEGAGIAVEFWDAIGDEWHAPVPNAWTQRMPLGAATARLDVAGRDLPTHPLMALPRTTDVAFDVDVVVTWVDGDDPEWAAARAEREGADARREATGDARFRSRDELRYALRSLHLYAPWVRRIHLVTAGQRPVWLADHPLINVVDHRDILPADALPTFNSQAIETSLHRIAGLSEHFVYLNDDVFLGRPAAKELFFSSGGSFAAFESHTAIGLPGSADKPFLHAAQNNRDLLGEALGVANTSVMAHSPHPHRVSVLNEIAARFAGAVEATARSPFRSPDDVSMLSNLAQHYGLATGSAHRGVAEHAFVDLSNAQVARQLDRVLRRDLDFFCVGDHHDFALEPEAVDSMLADFLEEYFPVAAPWETRG